MTLEIEHQPVPLTANDDGVFRVGKTRITLDTVVGAFNDGATPEEIALQYPSLELPDIYAVIGYYLRRRTDVEAYLRQREHDSRQVRQENESRFDPHGVRDRLLSRKKPSRS